LAPQIGAFLDVAQLLSHSLGEEESTDNLLTEIAKPLIQQATAEDWEAEEVHA
jgi:ferritin-like metal-binding protein YciE